MHGCRLQMKCLFLPPSQFLFDTVCMRCQHHLFTCCHDRCHGIVQLQCWQQEYLHEPFQYLLPCSLCSNQLSSASEEEKNCKSENKLSFHTETYWFHCDYLNKIEWGCKESTGFLCPPTVFLLLYIIFFLSTKSLYFIQNCGFENKCVFVENGLRHKVKV